MGAESGAKASRLTRLEKFDPTALLQRRTSKEIPDAAQRTE
jgi:hypothetical protein